MKTRINYKIYVMSLIILLFSSLSVDAATTYYVATNGNDANPGTLAALWRHVAFATCAAAVLTSARSR